MRNDAGGRSRFYSAFRIPHSAFGRSVPLLVVGAALDGSFAFFVMVMQAFLPETLSSGAGAPGFALGIYGGTRVLLQLPGGLLARRVGGRRMVLIGTVIGALALLAMTGASSIAQVYMLTLVYGAATALAWPAIYLLAGDQTTDERGALLSLLTFCALAGMGGGIVLGAVLVDIAPARVLIPLGAAMLGAGAMANLTPRPPSLRGKGVPRLGGMHSQSLDTANATSVRPTPNGGTPVPARDGGRGGRSTLLALVPALALQGIGLSMLLPLLRQYAHDQLGLELPELIIFGVPAGVAAVAVFLPAGKLADRIGRGPVVAVGSALAGVGVLLLAQATSPWLFLLGAVPLAAGYAASAPALGAWITDLTDSTGTSVGLALTVQGSALAVGPVLTGLLIANHGAPLPMRVSAAMWILAAAVAVRRHVPRSTFHVRR